MTVVAMVRRHERAARMRLLLKVGAIALLAWWVLDPRALIFQHARTGLSVLGTWMQSHAIAALGGMERQSEAVPAARLAQLQPVNGYAAADLRCLALAIYYDAGRERREAQIALGQTVLNRARAAGSAQALCRVVYQGMGTAQGCHYAAACRNVGQQLPTDARLAEAIDVASGLVAGRLTSATADGATHFHDAVHRPPSWARKLERRAALGNLVFYAPSESVQPAVDGGPAASMAIAPAGSPAAPSRASPSRAAEPVKASPSPSRAETSEMLGRVFGLHH